MNGMIYFLQVNLYLLAFYAFYHLLLSRETFFRLNRFYLIGSTLLAFCIPLLQSDWLKDLLTPKQIQQASVQFNAQAYELLFATQTEAKNLSLGEVLSWIYFTVAFLLLIRLAYRLIRTYRWVRNPQNELQACSFFGYIAVDEDLEGREAIMVHEQVHVQESHSVDVLFFELNAIINWFNPIAYLYKSDIRKLHEYIADAVASETLPEKSTYAMLLFHENFGAKVQNLTNSFFNQSILKQRIMMLQKNKSKKVALVKYGFIVPLFLGMLILSSAFVSKQTTKQVEKSVLADTIPTLMSPPNPKNPPKQDISKILSNLANGTIPSDNIIYIVNGKEISASEIKKIDVKNIESIKVIKGEEAQNKYGVRAIEGAMEILLKKDGNPTIAANDSKKTIYLPKKETKKAVPALKINGEKGKGGTIEVLVENSTENAGVKPLIVVDGKVMEAGFDMNSIKPTDIASVSILKDESATAAYGEKAKNGVVQITLKKKN